MDEKFECHACGTPIDIPDRTRFALSVTRPAVCSHCGAPHVYEAGIQMDQAWVKQQLAELAALREEQALRRAARERPRESAAD